MNPGGVPTSPKHPGEVSILLPASSAPPHYPALQSRSTLTLTLTLTLPGSKEPEGETVEEETVTLPAPKQQRKPEQHGLQGLT